MVFLGEPCIFLEAIRSSSLSVRFDCCVSGIMREIAVATRSPHVLPHSGSVFVANLQSQSLDWVIAWEVRMEGITNIATPAQHPQRSPRPSSRPFLHLLASGRAWTRPNLVFGNNRKKKIVALSVRRGPDLFGVVFVCSPTAAVEHRDSIQSALFSRLCGHVSCAATPRPSLSPFLSELRPCDEWVTPVQCCQNGRCHQRCGLDQMWVGTDDSDNKTRCLSCLFFGFLRFFAPLLLLEGDWILFIIELIRERWRRVEV